MAERQKASSNSSSGGGRRGLSTGPATVIAMVVSTLLATGLVAVLDALVFSR